jgi:hypothetical protein
MCNEMYWWTPSLKAVSKRSSPSWAWHAVGSVRGSQLVSPRLQAGLLVLTGFKLSSCVAIVAGTVLSLKFIWGNFRAVYTWKLGGYGQCSFGSTLAVLWFSMTFFAFQFFDQWKRELHQGTSQTSTLKPEGQNLICHLNYLNLANEPTRYLPLPARP